MKSKSSVSQEENNNWNEATTGLFAKNYWKSMKVDIDHLESMGSWVIFDRDDSMNSIDSAWAFKCKRYPDGLLKIFKYRFCARGNQQLEGIDFFETCAPVVQWETVWLMLILEVLLGFNSKKVGFTAEYIHSDIPNYDKVYVEISRLFEQFSNNVRQKCFKMKKTLYCLNQSSCAF